MKRAADAGTFSWAGQRRLVLLDPLDDVALLAWATTPPLGALLAALFYALLRLVD